MHNSIAVRMTDPLGYSRRNRVFQRDQLLPTVSGDGASSPTQAGAAPPIFGSSPALGRPSGQFVSTMSSGSLISAPMRSPVPRRSILENPLFSSPSQGLYGPQIDREIRARQQGQDLQSCVVFLGSLFDVDVVADQQNLCLDNCSMFAQLLQQRSNECFGTHSLLCLFGCCFLLRVGFV